MGSIKKIAQLKLLQEEQATVGKRPLLRLILMTNAGSTGLNLQSANTVINVDLPHDQPAC